MNVDYQWEKFRESIIEISTVLARKGYDGAFKTAGGHLGKAEESINRYAYASVLGDEPGFKNGVSLQTYLIYEPDADNILMNFKVSPGDQTMLRISEVEIQKWDSHQMKFVNITLCPTTYQEIPSKAEAVKMINPELKQKQQRRFRL